MPPRTGDAIHHQSSSATSVEQEHGELIDMPAVRKALLRMVIALEENFHDREDLLQEAIVCFLSREQQYPGQRRRWYLQSVNFYLQHFRTSGRSLDSPKRRGAQASFPDDCDEWDNWRDSLECDEGFLSAVVARDLFSLLVERLGPTDQAARAKGPRPGRKGQSRIHQPALLRVRARGPEVAREPSRLPVHRLRIRL